MSAVVIPFPISKGTWQAKRDAEVASKRFDAAVDALMRRDFKGFDRIMGYERELLK